MYSFDLKFSLYYNCVHFTNCKFTFSLSTLFTNIFVKCHKFIANKLNFRKEGFRKIVLATLSTIFKLNNQTQAHPSANILYTQATLN